MRRRNQRSTGFGPFTQRRTAKTALGSQSVLHQESGSAFRRATRIGTHDRRQSVLLGGGRGWQTRSRQQNVSVVLDWAFLSEEVETLCVFEHMRFRKLLRFFSSYDRPKLIESLKCKRIRDVACGSSHSAAVTSSGELYTWGSGEYGRLGHGDNVTQLKPKLVLFASLKSLT